MNHPSPHEVAALALHFCADPTPSQFGVQMHCIEAPGHLVSDTLHRDLRGNTWIVSQKTIDAVSALEERHNERSRQDLLRRDLRDKYMTAGMPEAVSDRLFEWAWQEGHSAGSHEVEMHYEALKDVVNKAFRAGREAGRSEGRPSCHYCN